MTKKKTEVAAEVAERARATAPQPSIADLVTALGGLVNRPQAQVALVGIRNISGNTIGIPPFGNEPGFSLNPFSLTDPNSMAVVSLPRWQSLRKGTLYGQGMLERYDDILDESTPRAPADKPVECHPDHEKNRVLDPHQLITESSDADLRKFILAMTSESQLHRIIAAVDQKCRELELAIRASGEPTVNPAEKAVEELPVNYQMAERLVQWRLNQIIPGRTDDGGLPKFNRNR